ncbi:MAG TPA: NAD kinase [Nakamurella sp.]
MTPRRRMLLVAHTGRPDVDITARKVAATLAEAGIDLVASTDESRELGLNRFEPTDDGDGATASIEMVLAIGGDGTLLRAAEQARPLSAPVLGINRGRVGFLTEVDVDHVDAGLQAIIDQRYRVSSRMTVQVSVEHEGRFVTAGWALNEISVEKVSRERILDVVVEVDGHGVSAYGCDGVLCATPTGSTAYTFSAGGPVLWPGVDALLVAPSNAHALFARSLVVSPESTVTVHIDPAGPSAILVCDGRRTQEIPPGSRVHVCKGDKPVTLVRLGDQTFTDRLVRKFKLPVHGWRDQRH